MCLPGTIEAVRESGPAVSRRAVLAGGGAAALAALVPSGAEAHGRQGHHRHRHHGQVVDLTHTFTAGFPVYAGNAPSKRTLTTIAANGFYKQEWTFDEHSGTHLDAPGHFIAGGRTTPQLSALELIVPVVVIDISKRAGSNPDAEVTADDIKRHEQRHGRIPDDALVAMHSGWAAKLGTPAYKGADAGGGFHFPGFGISAIEYLLGKRKAAAIGVDTLSLDNGLSATFVVHSTWLGADNYGIENLAGLDRLPAAGATATVGVVPWEEGSGGPARVIATY
jgi:kynurenine formamidase